MYSRTRAKRGNSNPCAAELHFPLVFQTRKTKSHASCPIRAMKRFCLVLVLALLVVEPGLRTAKAVDLLQLYPTTLAVGDTSPEKARSWEFTTNDIFHIAKFSLVVGNDLRVECGPAEVGIGHCTDGAVWAVLIPQVAGNLVATGSDTTNITGIGPGTVSHVWLRFHPKTIADLFPGPEVQGPGNVALVHQIRAIAGAKLAGSWHAGSNVTIPEPNVMTVDLDTEGPVRRFFAVDLASKSAKYFPPFEKRPVRMPPPLTPEQSKESFDQLWDVYDREYAMFAIRPEVDWKKSREDFRPRALAATNTFEFAALCAEMLRPLRDLHIWVEVSGSSVPVFNRVRTSNANPAAWAGLLGKMNRVGRAVEWVKTPEKIGYIAIHQWNDDSIPRQVDVILEEMRDTRGLVIDVRLNGGGSEPLARDVAGRFLGTNFVYAFSRYRNGPKHEDLGERNSRTVEPRGPWRYNRPVVLLIGQKCMSSNESFIAMMSGDDQVTTMGDHTCGSSGNPKMLRLHGGLTVSVPRWIDYLPDGTPLDERGFVPQIVFQPKPDSFKGDHDDLLLAALNRLRALSLPAKPIEGPVLPAEDVQAAARGGFREPDYAAIAREEAKDPARPKLVAFSPADGAGDVPASTEVRLRFDRAMDPFSIKLDWDSGGFLWVEPPTYDTGKHEFAIPLRLAAGVPQEVFVNKTFPMEDVARARAMSPREGFISSDARLAGLATWKFRSKAAQPADAKGPAPTVREITPKLGATVSLLCFVELAFDRPMMLPAEALPYVVRPSGFERVEMISYAEYDPSAMRYRLALLLPPKKKMSFEIAGFRGAGGATCAPVKLEYQSGTGVYPDGFEAEVQKSAKDERLLSLLASMAKAREGLTSIVERVQSISMNQDKGAFTTMRATSARFVWESPNRFLADATGPMSSCDAFRVGCDGTNAWWHYEGHKKRHLTVSPVKEMHRMNLSFCDPFDLTTLSPEKAASAKRLKYAGKARRGDRECHLVETWEAESFGESTTVGSLHQWAIDAQTLRPSEFISFGQGYVYRLVFHYDSVNGPVPEADFIPPELPSVPKVPLDALDADYTERFLNGMDGANGNMSVRWGKRGPKGISSSGLN